MKTKAKALFLTVAVMVGGHALSQQAGARPNPKIDPITGMPASPGSTANYSTTTVNQIDPLSGLPTGPGPTISNSATNLVIPAVGLPPDNDAYRIIYHEIMDLLLQAQSLTTSGKYDQALQCFLRLEARTQAITNNAVVKTALLKTALPGWVELGKKYPAARSALIDIRDRSTREFVQSPGDLQLFQKVADIDEVLGNYAATVDLFKSLRQNNPSEAGTCYDYAEPALVRCGEYQLCLECLGNPEVRFNIFCHTLKQSYQTQSFVVERTAENHRRALEVLQQPGRPPVPPYLLHPKQGEDIGLQAITNLFADKVSNLVEILAHTDHQELADKIRGDAAAVLNGLPLPATSQPVSTPETAGSSVVFDTPFTIAPSNQFFGPTIELTLTVNSNGLSDALNLDYGTVVPLRDFTTESFLFAHLAANGIAIFPPREMGAALTPLKLVSKRTQFLQRPDSANQQPWNGATPPAWLQLPAPMQTDAMNLLYDQAMANLMPPVLFGFQTSLGNAGLLQIIGFTEQPRGVKLRYKLLHNPNPPEIPDPAASPEDWSPAQPPKGIPALAKFQSAIKKLMDQDRYAEALERQVWYFNHSLQYGDTEVNRLSFGIMHWPDLIRCCPEAKLAAIKIRDRKTHEFSTGGSSGLFWEISTLNVLLHDDDATMTLFKSIDQRNEQLAHECYGHAEAILVRHGEYALCLKYLGDPQARFEGFCAARQNTLHSQDHTPVALLEQQEKTVAAINRQLAVTNGQSKQKDIFQVQTAVELTKQAAHDNFVRETRQLIEILVATGHQAESGKIRDEALGVIDDPGLKSAISDAREKLRANPARVGSKTQ
jgi:hypothetical protein